MFRAFSQVSEAVSTGNAYTQEGVTSLDDSLKEPGASVAADLPPSPCPDDMERDRNTENTDEDIADENDPNGTNNQDCAVNMQDEEEGIDEAIKDNIKKKRKQKKSSKVNTELWLLTVRIKCFLWQKIFAFLGWHSGKEESKD